MSLMFQFYLHMDEVIQEIRETRVQTTQLRMFEA